AFAVDGASFAGATYANSGVDASQPFTFDDGPSDHTVTVRVIDKDGGFTDYTASIHVTNRAPTATLQEPASVNEGSTFSVGLTAPSDASQTDTAAGFHYAFAVDGASLTGATYANSGTDAVQPFTFDDGPSDHTVTVRIIDKDGGFTDYTASIHVTNVAPTATLQTPASVNEGSAFSVGLTSVTDPSQADTAAG